MNLNHPDPVNMVELLSSGRFQHAVLCTYDFNARLFEDYWLTDYRALYSLSSLSILMDDQRYKALLTSPEDQQPRAVNRKYFLHPILPGRRFHPKLYLFAAEDRGLLIVGSANLTDHGLHRNAELVVPIAFSGEEEGPALDLFRSAFSFVNHLAERWPSQALSGALREMLSDAPWLACPRLLGNSPVILVDNLFEPILPQIIVKLNEPVLTVTVLSPFFDTHPSLLDWITQNADPGCIRIYTHRDATGLNQEWMDHSSIADGRTKIFLGQYGQDEHPRQLHGKALLLETPTRKFLLSGSANFTSAALLKTATDGNVEVGILSCHSFSSKRATYIFDPFKKAHPLEDLAQLSPRPPEPPPEPAPPLRLLEAAIDGTNLICTLEEVLDEGACFCTARISQEKKEMAVPLHKGPGPSLTTRLDTEMLDRLAQRVAVVLVEVHLRGDQPRRSNLVYLLNLQDDNGEAVRSRRVQRECQMSVHLFAEHYERLSASNAEQELAKLLSDLVLCPGAINSSLAWAFARTLTKDSSRFWAAPCRSRRLFNDLTEAAADFISRHEKRLKALIDLGESEEIQRAWEICCGICFVGADQLSRATTLLLQSGSLVKAETWERVRSAWAKFLPDVINAATMLINSPYGNGQNETHLPRGTTASIEMIQDLLTKIVADGDEILEVAQQQKVRILTEPTRKQVPLPLYPTGVLNPKAWRKNRGEIETLLAHFFRLSENVDRSSLG